MIGLLFLDDIDNSTIIELLMQFNIKINSIQYSYIKKITKPPGEILLINCKEIIGPYFDSDIFILSDKSGFLDKKNPFRDRKTCVNTVLIKNISELKNFLEKLKTED